MPCDAELVAKRRHAALPLARNELAHELTAAISDCGVGAGKFRRIEGRIGLRFGQLRAPGVYCGLVGETMDTIGMVSAGITFTLRLKS